MKVAIYSPYLDTLGGGEKYMMTIAEILSKTGSETHVLLDNHLYTFGPENLKKELAERFALDLKGVDFIKGPLGKNSNFFQRLSFLNNYDLFFYLTDGSILYPTSRKNILHIQSPLQPASKNFWERIKLNGWDLILYNSNFTRDNAKDNWPIKSQVVYPPVDVEKINKFFLQAKTLKKKKYILSVGRFFGYLKDKKQAILIKIFGDLVNDFSAKGWSLNLAGSATFGDESYIEELKNMAKGLPVNFYPNLEHDKLVKLYGEASIYWHAAGFDEDDPTKMEHFGISTVEAMAAGCVPVVIAKGGQEEIIEKGKSGYLWQDLNQCKQETLKLIKNIKLRNQMAKEATRRAWNFRKKNFEKEILEISKI